uniref:22.0 kDa class IV heat shock protein-like n=1 Tax=Erigeron canadensis TaxID=72917 RepID=UPI001CB8DB71|nr:22.0 kDa class IV heat shock protein-like [Erigeron canadensis]
MRPTIILIVFLYLLFTSTTCTESSLLSLLNNNPPDPIQTTLLSDLFTNPFQELDHIPFGITREDELIASPAKVDWKETPERHVITLDVPGMKKEELKIEIEQNRVLRVSGERKRETEEKGDHWHRSERAYGKFWRQFKLPDNVDLDKVDAKLEDGVLAISIKKLAADRIKGPKVVSIGGGEEPSKITEAKTEL